MGVGGRPVDVRRAPRRREPEQPTAHPEPGADRADEPPRLARQAEGLAQRLVHDGDRHASHQRPHRRGGHLAGDPDRRLGQPGGGRGVGEAATLVVEQQREVSVVRRGQVLEAHQLAEAGGHLRDRRDARGGRAVASRRPRSTGPADDRRREDVGEVLGRDVVAPVDAVEPAQRRVRARRVDAVQGGLVADEDGVVVALDAVVLELARPVEELAIERHAVVAHEGDAGALDVVPRELVARGQPQDLVVVDLRVEGADPAQVVVATRSVHGVRTPIP